MTLVTESMKAKAEVYHGDETCRQKFTLLLADMGLPVGLLAIQDNIEEYGYVKDVGFVWLKHKERKEHKFDNVMVCFDTLVTAYFEPNKIKNLTGVKAKEFLIWVSLREIYVVNDNNNNFKGYDSSYRMSSRRPSVITFKTPVGLSKSFPMTVFESGGYCCSRDHDWKERMTKWKHWKEIREENV